MNRNTHHHQSSRIFKRLVVFCLSLAVISLGVVNVWLSAKVSHIGIELKEVELKRIELAKTNVHIENQIQEETALNKLQQIAVERGFFQKAKIARLSPTLPLAQR